MAVENTIEIAQYYRRQLDALTNAHQSSIFSTDPRRIAGSVNIDSALQPVCPNDNRWDYAIGYRHNNRDDKVFFVEFHKATVDEVQRVLAKKQWLESWMLGKPIADLDQRKYVWISAGGIKIPPNSKQRRIIDSNGLRLVRRLGLK